MFCTRAGTCKQKKTSFLTSCMANFGLTATSLFFVLCSPARSSASTSRVHKLIFSLLDRMVLSFFFGPVSFFFSLFLPRTFFRFWFFHEQIDSTSEFCKVRDVNKIWNKHENLAQTWTVAARDSPRCASEIMTPSWFINFYLKIRFSK